MSGSKIDLIFSYGLSEFNLVFAFAAGCLCQNIDAAYW